MILTPDMRLQPLESHVGRNLEQLHGPLAIFNRAGKGETYNVGHKEDSKRSVVLVASRRKP